ncbi:type II toxin-antitoxin system RelE family toxin [Salinigranum halophilum]|uniref:type II toxin-antitoxin system RelE family toxin n=1 Tax=Salinigranum halophilum TaxID=2565931 RepID=UPI0010A93634|nr:hypothetical protein [Salinigranum halophilum]
MVYCVTFSSSPPRLFAEFSTQEKDQTLKKLYEIATSEFRTPYDFDLKQLRSTDPRWRLRVGNGIRVILTVDERAEALCIEEIGRRENLYQ